MCHITVIFDRIDMYVSYTGAAVNFQKPIYIIFGSARPNCASSRRMASRVVPMTRFRFILFSTSALPRKCANGLDPRIGNQENFRRDRVAGFPEFPLHDTAHSLE